LKENSTSRGSEKDRQYGLDSERLERFPISRVHAAYLEAKGQPFYGWFVDGSDDKI
jgi:hypothetical protein